MQKKQTLSKALPPLPDGTIPACILTVGGTITGYNEAMAHALGGHRKITGRTCRSVFGCPAKDAALCPLKNIRRKPGRHSVLIPQDDHTIRETVEPVFDGNGRLKSILLSISTNHAAADRLTPDLAKLQKLETLAQAAGGIVHDLNNIMTVIDGEMLMLEAKLDRGSIDLKNDSSLQAIIPTIARGRGLIDQLVRFSRGGSPDKGPTAIGSVISEAVTFALLGSHIKASVDISSDILPVYTNNEQIFQLVSNLVINARQSMKNHNDGPISVQADHLPVSGGTPHGLPPGNYVRLSVSDHGQGIPPENIRKIFDPFFTTKQDGTGLGLALVKLIVSDLGGRITVDSTLGKGTTFVVFIPAME